MLVRVILVDVNSKMTKAWRGTFEAVSYTHLTLPTILRV